MRILIYILAVLVLIEIACAENLIINFNAPKPEIYNVSVKLTQYNNQPAVFCSAITNPDSDVKYKWYINEELQKTSEPVITNIRTNDVVKCEAIATNGFENVSDAAEMIISDTNPITGFAVRTTGNGNGLNIILTVGVVVLLGLISINAFLFYKKRK
jgi:hypothetical protein